MRRQLVQQRPQGVRHRVVVEEFRPRRIAELQHLRPQVGTLRGTSPGSGPLSSNDSRHHRHAGTVPAVPARRRPASANAWVSVHTSQPTPKIPLIRVVRRPRPSHGPQAKPAAARSVRRDGWWPFRFRGATTAIALLTGPVGAVSGPCSRYQQVALADQYQRVMRITVFSFVLNDWLYCPKGMTGSNPG